MHREAIIALMQDPVAQELIKAPIHARLAYSARDGSPRVIPIGYAWTGEVFVMASPVNAPKVTALAANPKVALTVDTDRFPPHVLLVRGEAAVEVVDGVPDAFVAASRRFVGAAGLPAWEAGVRALYQRMAIIRVTPTWAKVLDFETRLPSPVEELIKGNAA
jgi:Pyridoxamine 5'-phosphate oxidase